MKDYQKKWEKLMKLLEAKMRYAKYSGKLIHIRAEYQLEALKYVKDKMEELEKEEEGNGS
jgi:hypothetical protein